MNPMTGYASSNGPLIHFGLKNTDSVISLEVDWPDGIKHSFDDIKANNHYVISQSNSEGDRTSKNIATKPNTIFNEVSGISSAKHSETFFDDFELQPLLPNKLSHYGPGLAVGDTNRDGVNEFIVSSAKGETLSIHSQKDNTISSEIIPIAEAHSISEDMSPLIFDADKDGDMDLYVVSGGVESEQDTVELQDRLYLNDGQGNYELAPAEALPKMNFSGSAVAASDFDRDGDLDLFVGGRLRRGSIQRVQECSPTK